VLDAASAMQNLREAIAGYRGRLMQESGEEKRNALLQARTRTCALPALPRTPRRVPAGSLSARRWAAASSPGVGARAIAPYA